LRTTLLLTLLALVFLAAVVPATAAQPPSNSQPAAVSHQRCEDLAKIAVLNLVVKSATTVPAGPFRVPSTRPDANPVNVPQFCRVVAQVRPELNFEVWLPAQWNRKYAAVGNGGLAGSIVYNSMLDPLNRGYATSGTDTGHVGANTNDGTWALGHMDRVINFGQRGVHEMAIASKVIIRAYYGSGPVHSYFSGCSYGGKQALTEVQKYPTDFDGVIAGDPANWWTRHYSGSHIWVAQAVDGDGWLPPNKVQLLADAVNGACDALDGVKDGVLTDPRRCHYDPGALQCKSGDAPNCLTSAQVEAVRKIWAGPRDASGQRLYPGLERGGEAGPGGWVQWVTGSLPGFGSHSGLGLPFMKYVVYEDPNWDFRKFRYTVPAGLESDLEYTEDKVGRIFDAIEPDLTPFRARGGKLLQYHGFSDPDIPPQNSIDYYERVVAHVGGGRNNPHALQETKEFYRLFMVPGMQHCAGGPGTSRFDPLAALEDWVEQNKAPEQMTAAHVTNGQIDRTRPLCAYPTEAKYKGTGSTDDAANFTCALP
jgi:feruloyl esterase